MKEATYLGMTLTSTGFLPNKNIVRGRMAMSKVQMIAGATRICDKLNKNSTNSILETYMRSRYLYNASLLNEGDKLKEIDREVCGRIFRTLMKSKEGALTRK